MSNTIKSLNAIYTQQIAEDEDRVAITPEDAAAVGQHVRAIKYEARKSGEPLPRAYNTYVGKHNLTATQRRITKEKLGLAEEVEAPIKIKPKDQKEDSKDELTGEELSADSEDMFINENNNDAISDRVYKSKIFKKTT